MGMLQEDTVSGGVDMRGEGGLLHFRLTKPLAKDADRLLKQLKTGYDVELMLKNLLPVNQLSFRIMFSTCPACAPLFIYNGCLLVVNWLIDRN